MAWQIPSTCERFVDAQDRVYDAVLGELRAGRKRSHWIWFVFPQLRGLGRSPTAEHYGIASLRRGARPTSAHDVLGPRLRECARLVAAIDGRSVDEIFGWPDDLKLRSSMTLFAARDRRRRRLRRGARQVLRRRARTRPPSMLAQRWTAMISPAVRLDLEPASTTVLRRRARPRDDLAAADAELGQRHRQRRIVDVERHQQRVVVRSCVSVDVLACWSGAAATSARRAATGGAGAARSGAGAAGRRRGQVFVDSHWASGEFGSHGVVAAEPLLLDAAVGPLVAGVHARRAAVVSSSTSACSTCRVFVELAGDAGDVVIADERHRHERRRGTRRAAPARGRVRGSCRR